MADDSYSKVRKNSKKIEAHWESRLPAGFKVGDVEFPEYRERNQTLERLIVETQTAKNNYKKKMDERNNFARKQHKLNQKYRPAIHTALGKDSPEYQSSDSLYQRDNKQESDDEGKESAK